MVKRVHVCWQVFAELSYFRVISQSPAWHNEINPAEEKAYITVLGQWEPRVQIGATIVEMQQECCTKTTQLCTFCSFELEVCISAFVAPSSPASSAFMYVPLLYRVTHIRLLGFPVVYLCEPSPPIPSFLCFHLEPALILFSPLSTHPLLNPHSSPALSRCPVFIQDSCLSVLLWRMRQDGVLCPLLFRLFFLFVYGHVFTASHARTPFYLFKGHHKFRLSSNRQEKDHNGSQV